MTLTTEIWSWFKVMTHSLVRDKNCVKYQIQHNISELWPGQELLRCVQCDLDLGDMNADKGHDMLLGSWTTIVWYIIQVQLHSGPDNEFSYVCIVALTLEMLPVVKVITLLGWGQKSCEISRSNLPGSSKTLWPDKDFSYMCTVTLTCEIWPWVNVIFRIWWCLYFLYPGVNAPSRYMYLVRRLSVCLFVSTNEMWRSYLRPCHKTQLVSRDSVSWNQFHRVTGLKTCCKGLLKVPCDCFYDRALFYSCNVFHETLPN